MHHPRPTGLALPAILTLVLVCFGGQAWAQMGQQPRAPAQPSALEQEYLDLQQRLLRAQHDAVRNSSALRERMEGIEDLITRKMREAGYDPGTLMETLLAYRGQLQQPGLSDAERQAILQSPEFVQAEREWQEAQQKVGQDAEVIAAQQGLQQATLDAMRKEEAQTDRMIERLQQIQREAQQRGGR
jgi:hypothetical protein